MEPTKRTCQITEELRSRQNRSGVTTHTRARGHTHTQNQLEFYPTVNPWMNGAMETLVEITKKHLNTITRNHLFNEETLHTYFTEIESIINGRPLTPLSDDINNF